MDAELRVDHRHGVGTHLARAHGVVGGLRVLADIVDDLGIALNVGTGAHLGAAIGIHGLGLHDAAGGTHAGDQGLSIDGGRQKVEADFRRHHRIRRADVNRASALRPKLAHGNGHAGIPGELALLDVLDGEGDEVKLHVRRLELRARAQKREHR